MTSHLTLGPVLFHWDADKKRDFYARIADEAPIDTVYLGEVICSKRAPYFDAHYPEVVERLERGGKRVVFSSLSEVMLKREREMTASLCETEDYEVEINNTAGLMHIGGKHHRIGPLMNVYNSQTMRYLAGKGAQHFSLPVELPRQVVEKMAATASELKADIEIQVFGRASLAVSARCYHARSHGRTKDNCQYVCEEDPDGMPLETIVGQPFLAINGIQTLSHSYVNLLREIDEMRSFGIHHFRLSPHNLDMVRVADIFEKRIAGDIDAEEADAQLTALEIDAPFSNGFWHGIPGFQQTVNMAKAAE